MKAILKSLVLTAGVALALGTTNVRAATLIATIDGNDCAGVFGQGFFDCTIPASYDPDESPVIAKFDFSGRQTVISINTGLFPSVDGNEWSFDGPAMTWTYNPGPGDPVISFFVAKGSNAFNLFQVMEDELSAEWFTPDNASGGPAGLSHLTFYDTDGDTPPDVPEPITMALVGLGLLSFGFIRRR